MVEWKHQKKLRRAVALGLAVCLVLCLGCVPAEATGRGQSTGSTGVQRTAQEGSSLLLYVVGGLAVLAAAVAVLMIRKKPQPKPPTPDMEPTIPVSDQTVPSPDTLDIPVRREEWLLEVIDGPLFGLQYPIQKAGMLIGRSKEANIRYPEDTKGVSGRHCQVFWDNGSLKVMDLGSSQGTYLSGDGKLAPQKAYSLSRGSVIALGSQSCRIRVCSRSV